MRAVMLSDAAIVLTQAEEARTQDRSVLRRRMTHVIDFTALALLHALAPGLAPECGPGPGLGNHAIAISQVASAVCNPFPLFFASRHFQFTSYKSHLLVACFGQFARWSPARQRKERSNCRRFG